MRIDLFKMERLFDTFKGNPVTINVIGNILIPFYIDNFQWEHSVDEISFGEEGERDSRFRIDKDDLVGIHNEYELFGSEDKIVFEIRFDGFRTDYEVVFNCMLVD